MKNSQKGVIHLVLLVFVFLLVMGVIVAVMVFKPDLSSYMRKSDTKDNAVTTVTPTVTTTEVSDLEKEADADQLSDPSTDFTEVDEDINSL